MIIGTGTDIIEIERIARAYERYGARFLNRIFTGAEAAYCTARPKPAQHLAARFAAKEAVAKALGTGLKEGVGWRDIETLRRPGSAPRVVLHGGAKKAAERLGIRTVHISLTHNRDYALATAIAETGDAKGDCHHYPFGP